MASTPLTSSSQHYLDRTNWCANQSYGWQSLPPGAARPVRPLPPIPVPSFSRPSLPTTHYPAPPTSTGGYHGHPSYSPPPPYYNQQQPSSSSSSILSPPPPKDRSDSSTGKFSSPGEAYDTTPRGSGYAGAAPPMGSEWTPQQLLSELTRTYPALVIEWDTIFDARKHRVSVLPETWFQDGWELAGVHLEHILFIERAEKKRRVQIYDIPKMSIRLMDVKYEAAVLSWDGKYLLVGYNKVLQIIKVKSEKSVKRFKVKNLTLRKWTSNTKGFCWVDTEGRFWRWSYNPGEEPEQMFKLISTAPTYWMTPIAAHDGSWYAVVATEKDRRSGVVHAFPENHGEARIFHGPAAAVFTRVVSGGVTENAIVMMSMTQEGKNGCLLLDVQGLSKYSRAQKKARANITLSDTMKLFPDIFVDEHSSLAVTAISTNATNVSLALIFEPQGGKFIASRRLFMDNGDRIFCGVFGLHMERNASMFRRLKVYPDGPPNPDYVEAEEALFRSKSPRSSLSGQTDSGSAPATRTFSRFTSRVKSSSHATSVSAHSEMTGSVSLGKGKGKVNSGPVPTWGGGKFAPKDSDESWMFEKQRRGRWQKEDHGDDSDSSEWVVL
ncbi:hypothetical protein FRC00_012732 [Tulasnella sp. 408]|nr:hypothetical protein FRC00_012732 [Tulasnella sp. 408]